MTTPIHPGVRIGHVHLKVADLERALGFYCGVLGFELQQRFGSQAAFISAGSYHHHLGLNTWESQGGSPPPPGTTGLYHVAILYPVRAALADALRRLQAAGIPLDGASDHGVSEALYLRDPDENGVETVLGPATGTMAARRPWRTRHVYSSVEFGFVVGRKCGLTDCAAVRPASLGVHPNVFEGKIVSRHGLLVLTTANGYTSPSTSTKP